ncbi:platelet glycoprotein V-like [Stylophora pistillata]|uniref:platelet glycoprotein V-like n=1 Tax=Stylophora pistillata TaxID=50429 RepID=UPI000C0397C8|nr:platelet glycoprotein V-like [Stylophora pistillata]
MINFNKITHINNRTFAGLSSLNTLMLIRNNLAFIAKDVFDETPLLESLFLHSNAIKTIESKSFDRLVLKQLTIFDNPIPMLPDDIFDKMTNNTKVSLTCKNLLKLPRGKYMATIPINDAHHYNTRSSTAGNFYINYSRLNHYKSYFSSMGAKIWNCIPDVLRQLPK